MKWSVFFDQDLGRVVFEKLMKANVKDYKILLWLSKLGQTVSNISHELTEMRDKIAEETGLKKYLETAPTEEDMKSTEYQESSKTFSERVQKELFEKEFDLDPLGPLTLTEEVITSAGLTPEDMIKLERTGFVKLPA